MRIAKRALPKIEVITSAWNEEDCLDELFIRLERVFEAESSYEWSITIFDNGSKDSTWEIIKKNANSRRNLRGIRMSRNFSLDAALSCGIEISDADAVILMASDLQDPPETIPILLRKFEQGYDQVLVKVISRKHVPFIRRFMSNAFYTFASNLTAGLLPEKVSDFRLMNKKSYKALTLLKERHRFLRGLTAWIGFESSIVEIERPKRHAGSSKWMQTNILSVINSALTGIYTLSARPLFWVAGLGLVSSFVSLFFLIALSVWWLIGNEPPFRGFGTIFGLVSLGFSLTILAIGIVAQYLALVYEEVKGRPIYLVSQTINIDENTFAYQVRNLALDFGKTSK